MAANFDISPEKEAQVLSFLQRQLFFQPAEVTGVRLDGKTAIVTGSNVGVGLESARQLLDLGVSKLILAVRNDTKGKAAAADLAKGRSLKEDAIEVWPLDQLSYASVQAFAERTKTLDRIDIVILNAGILPAKQVHAAETGHDEGIQVNYLSTVLLLVLLLAVVKEKPTSQPTRFTLVNSDGAAWTKFGGKDEDALLPALDKPDHWGMPDRNFVAKLLTQLFVTELVKSVPTSLAIINLVTPGMIHDSEMSRETRDGWLGWTVEHIRRRVGSTSAVGARLVVDAGVNHGSESHGQYLSEQKLKP
jgi:NAD(P)-dependent dehydrogenase (short-subunit alcohol dehydrogenase family)